MAIIKLEKQIEVLTRECERLLKERDTYKQQLDEIDKKIIQILDIAYLSEDDEVNIVYVEELQQIIEADE